MKFKLLFPFAPIAIVFAALSVSLADRPATSPVQVSSLKSGKPAVQQTGRAGLVDSLKPAVSFEPFAINNPDKVYRSDTEFLETVLSYGRNEDPRNTFVLVNAYLNANQQKVGIAFFEQLLKRYGGDMSSQVRATYLAAYAILRATYADRVPLLDRVGWVHDTFDILDEAARLAKGRNVLVRWSAGMIYAQVPFFFFKRDAAYAELNWLAEHPESEPTMGFFREVYRTLARLHAEDGNTEEAGKFAKLSGYGTRDPQAMFMGWFTAESSGASMASTPTMEEIVPGRVFAFYGYGFSDVYFVLSDDGEELIAVDAGTQPHSLKAAHDDLKNRFPNLPKVTAAIVTHAHWDHIGGLTYLKSISPNLKVYGRGNFKGTLGRALRKHSYHQYRGDNFKREWIESYRPDIPVDVRTSISIGGTKIDLIPVAGGETEDALFVHLPGLKTMFVGDFLMPYYGEPWVEEGLIDEAIAAMDTVIAVDPKYILHGHRPLTILYAPEPLKRFRDDFKWLVDATRTHLKNGFAVSDIVRLNLIPPGLQNRPDAYISYLSPRDHIIARVGDKMVGIWREDITGQEPRGLDTLTAADYGRFLENYLQLSPRGVVLALRRAIDAGDNALAFSLATAALKRFPKEDAIKRLRAEAADRLRSAAQFFDPFKFIAYTEMVGSEHRPMPRSQVNER